MQVKSYPAADAANDTARSLLREAIAAFDVALHLSNVASEAMRASCLATFRQRFPTDCLDKHCARYTAEDRAMELVRQNQHLQAVNLLCTSAAAVTMALSAQEIRLGLPSAQSMRRFWTIFRVCGVIAIKDVC